MPDPQIPITLHLQQLAGGDADAMNRLLPLVYDDLRAIARRMYFKDPGGHTLNATALVHEAYARLVGVEEKDYENRGHFMRVAAMAMRQLLANYARDQKAQKRGGDQAHETLQQTIAVGDGKDEPTDVVALDEALRQFGERFPRQARVVELRFFTGLSTAEAAEVLGTSERTARNDWNMARAWLSKALAS